MTMGCFDLKSECRDVMEEILAYKWLESEKVGQDIGMATAADTWIKKHYDEWFSHNAGKYEAE